MLICWLEPPCAKVQGDQIYRTRQPCADLALEAGTYAVSGAWLHPTLRAAAKTADVLVCAQSVDADLLAVFAERRGRGLANVFEVNDNFLEPRAFGAVGSFYHHPDQRTLALSLLAQADAVQTSSPYLAELFGPYAARCEVFANAVEHLPAHCPVPNASSAQGPSSLRIGWGGSAGHDQDLQAIMPALAQILAALPQSTLAIMAPASLRPLFAWVPPERLDFRLDGSLEAYHAFVQTLDIGLAPLCDTPFNRGRSDVKFLEYAAWGSCAVLQRAPAYAATCAQAAGDGPEAAALFDNNDELVRAVVLLGRDPALRGERRQAAFAYLQAHRTRAPMAARRRAFLRTLAGRAALSTVSAQARLEAAICAGSGTSMHKAPGLCHVGRAVQVGFDVASGHLFNGLLEEQAGRCGEADFRRAVARRPHDYLGQLYLGHHARKPSQAMAALERAYLLAPWSPAVAASLAQKAVTQGAWDRALQVWQQMLQQSAELEAGFAPPPGLALAAHAAALRVEGADPLAPLWAALAGALDHPGLARALATFLLQQAGPPPPALFKASCAALRRASRCYPTQGHLQLLLAQVLRLTGAWEACWSALHPLCDEAGVAAQGWDVGTARGVYALGAEAAQKTGRLASARRLANKARRPPTNPSF